MANITIEDYGYGFEVSVNGVFAGYYSDINKTVQQVAVELGTKVYTEDHVDELYDRIYWLEVEVRDLNNELSESS